MAGRPSLGSESRPGSALTTAVCRRAFSSPEALGYELAISNAVFDVVAPLVDAHRVQGAVLEVGSGGGRLAGHIADRTHHIVVGVDPSRSQARRMARRSRKRRGTAPVQASAEALPFNAGVFTTIVSSCALKHWPSAATGIEESSRVAIAGARILIIEIDGDSSVDDVAAFTRRTRIPPGLRDAYVRFALRTVVGVAPSATELQRLMVDGGLQAVAVDKIPGLPFAFGQALAP